MLPDYWSAASWAVGRGYASDRQQNSLGGMLEVPVLPCPMSSASQKDFSAAVLDRRPGGSERIDFECPVIALLAPLVHVGIFLGLSLFSAGLPASF